MVEVLVSHQCRLVDRLLAADVASYGATCVQTTSPVPQIALLVDQPTFALFALHLQTGQSLLGVRQPMFLQKGSMGETLGANVAHPIATSAVFLLLMGFKLNGIRVSPVANLTEVRLAFFVHVPLGVLLQEVILDECRPANVALEGPFRNGRVDPPFVNLQTGTVGIRFPADVTLEVVRIKMT